MREFADDLNLGLHPEISKTELLKTPPAGVIHPVTAEDGATLAFLSAFKRHVLGGMDLSPADLTAITRTTEIE